MSAEKATPSVHQAIFTIGKPLYPDQARPLIAALLGKLQPHLTGLIMNYQTDGRTRTGFPPVQFDYHHKGFALVGFGELGAQAVADAAPLIQACLANHFKPGIVNVAVRQLTLEAARSPYPIRYKVARMVTQKKGVHDDWLSDPDKGRAHIEGLFKRSLLRQGEAVNLEMPDFEVTFQGAERYDYMHFCVHKGDKALNGKPLAVRGLFQANFDVTLRLSGLWAAGYQLGPGFGKFNATLQRGLRI